MPGNCLRTLTRIRKFLSKEQVKRLSYEVDIIPNFKCCPLTCIFCGKTENNSINQTHRRTLQLIYEMEEATFEELFERDESKNIHENNTYTLLLKIYISLHHISHPIMRKFLYIKVNWYNFRSNYLLKLPAMNYRRHVTEALCFKGGVLWNKTPSKYKHIYTL